VWCGQNVSVVLMTYGEKESIRRVVDEFFATGVVDEVVVVNNNAEAGTSDEVAKTAAREVHEPRQGYGYATRRGLSEAEGEIIILAEPDGTFDATDVFKLLAYSDDCDAVFGTRTTRALIWHKANMGDFLRIGNRAVAKYVGILFGLDRLSDVGCTYRLLRRSVVDQIIDQLKIGGSQLGPELMLRTLLSGARVVEVPVNYLPRVGVSAVTGDLRKSIVLGLQMIALITRIRLQTLGQGKKPTPRSSRLPSIAPRYKAIAPSHKNAVVQVDEVTTTAVA
jgi:glycosyltransferase involved in cell wall biosynthesis